MKGYIHSVETFGAVDGPGIRYVVFMQGCPLRCLFCHNPDSWKLKDGKLMSVNELIKDIKRYQNYIKSGGVTLSGGEPLMQPKFALKLIKEIKKLNLSVALDTAGSLPLNVSKKILESVDLVLLDIKGLDSEFSVKLTGVSNNNTINTLKYCEEINKDVWIRIVVVPGYTASEEYMNNVAKFLTDFKCVKNIELLPFHKFGEHKWKELGIEYKLKDTYPPTDEEMKKYKNIFKKYKLLIKND